MGPWQIIFKFTTKKKKININIKYFRWVLQTDAEQPVFWSKKNLHVDPTCSNQTPDEPNQIVFYTM